jgi:hypothetical protein
MAHDRSFDKAHDKLRKLAGITDYDTAACAGMTSLGYEIKIFHGRRRSSSIFDISQCQRLS